MFYVMRTAFYNKRSCGNNEYHSILMYSYFTNLTLLYHHVTSTNCYVAVT